MTLPGSAARIAIILAGLGALVAATVESREGPLQVVTIAGRAETQESSASGWVAARLRAALGAGAAARTLQGRLALRTPGGQELRLPPVSWVSLLGETASDQPTSVRLEAGSVWAAVTPGSSPRQQIEVQTAEATVVVGGGGVEVTLGRDGSVLVRVFHGAAVCSGPGTAQQWSRALADGQELLVPAAGRPGRPETLDRDSVNPDWVKWNEDQDLAGGYGSAPAAK
jgi:hypothetical protein